MNQILGNQFHLSNNTSKSKKYKIIFWIFFIMLLLFIIVFITIKYNNYKKENFSKKLVKSYEITTLYNNNISNNYISSIKNEFNNNQFVIGLIGIEKINLLYPILSSTTDEGLKIAPCKFYGPMPNQIREFMYCRS